MRHHHVTTTFYHLHSRFIVKCIDIHDVVFTAVCGLIVRDVAMPRLNQCGLVDLHITFSTSNTDWVDLFHFGLVSDTVGYTMILLRTYL